MNILQIEATKSSPAIFFDPERGLLRISGESYPENAAAFYTPVFAWLKEYLAGMVSGQKIRIEMNVPYFNSSTSKVFLNFFDLLEAEAEKGTPVEVNWTYEEDNETALECGEDFQEEMRAMTFNLVTISE
jgi:hypothetical protein